MPQALHEENVLISPSLKHEENDRNSYIEEICNIIKNFLFKIAYGNPLKIRNIVVYYQT